MRYQGRIADWKDERGFGFIAPNGGGAKIFLHVSALRSGEPRPRGNELVTYDLAAADGKGSRAHDVAYVECVRTISSAHRDAPRRGSRPTRWIGLALLAPLAFYGWQRYAMQREVLQRGGLQETVENVILPASDARANALSSPISKEETSSPFKCEGKKYCSQMTSCAEATFYLRNCPNVEIDGDRDGIPCEKQHCK